MKRVHGWTTAAAVAILTLATAAPLAQGASRQRPAAKRRALPALATGASSDPAGSWRLEGRRLTVRLPGGLVPGGGAEPVDVLARCGDNVASRAYWPPIYADSAGRRLSVDADARTVSVVLSRDVAARTNLCALEVVAAGSDPTLLFGELRRRRGTPPGCRPGRFERVVHRGELVLVTQARHDDDMAWTDVYRACVPGGQLTTFEERGSGGGGGGGSHHGGGFVSAGGWLAWADDYVSHSSGNEYTTVSVADMRGTRATRPVTFTTRPGTFASTRALVVSRTGTVAWVRRIFPVSTASDVQQEVQVGHLDGTVSTLGRWIGPLREENAVFADLAISPDGRTVTWLEAGQPRSAALP